MNDILARCFFFLFFITTINIGYCQEWVPYQSQPTIQPTAQYPVYQYQPVVVYQFVPVLVQQNIVVERYCFFHKTQVITTRPEIRYIYQPVIIYR